MYCAAVFEACFNVFLVGDHLSVLESIVLLMDATNVILKMYIRSTIYRGRPCIILELHGERRWDKSGYVFCALPESFMFLNMVKCHRKSFNQSLNLHFLNTIFCLLNAARKHLYSFVVLLDSLYLHVSNVASVQLP